MTSRIIRISLLVTLCCCISLPALGAPAQPEQRKPLPSDVRRLYESAAYEEALGTVDLLLSDTAIAAADRRLLQRYRALCLLAVGTPKDAEAGVEELLHADPLFAPDEDMPPRLAALIDSVRRRIARTLVTDTYQRARDQLRSGDADAATADMTTVLALIDDATLGLDSDPFFVELRQLAEAFKNLNPPATADAVATVGSGAPAAEAPRADAPRDLSPAATTAPAAATPQAERSPASLAFVGPKAIRQPLPRFKPPFGGLTRREGEIAVDITADGSVSAARITVPLSREFDAMLVDAARQWQYEPARRLGVAVPYTLRVRIVLADR